MSKKQFNALPMFSETKNINVDVENGILKNVEIAKFGKNKNYTYFNEKFMNDLVEKGNAQTQGVKSRFGHPNMCASSLGTYIGRFKDFKYDNQKVYATLFLDQITKKVQVEGKGISMYDYIIEMASNNPDMFGNSIVVSCYSENEQITNEAGEIETVESLILVEFVSSDLVDDPAATDALFSSNPNDLGVIITDFLDNNPKIFDVIQKKPEIISDFFERYTNYSNRKSLINFNMSFLSKLKDKLAGKKDDAFDVNITLGDGTIITVVTDANEPQIGDEVVDESGNPLADGDYVTTDGGTITVAGGKISDMTQATDTPPDPSAEPTMQDVMNSVNDLKKIVTGIEKKFNATQKENESAFDVIADKLNVLGKNVKSKFEVPRAENTPKGKGAKDNSGYDPDKAREIRENRNK